MRRRSAFLLFVFGLACAPAFAQDRLVCRSDDYERTFCPASTASGVRLVRRISEAPCTRGRSWWRDARGIVVTAGCAAEFEVGHPDEPYVGEPSYGGYQDARFEPSRGRDWIRCESRDYRQNTCATGGRSVRLARQISRAACVEGESWGYTRRGIWVDEGCAADFEVY